MSTTTAEDVAFTLVDQPRTDQLPATTGGALAGVQDVPGSSPMGMMLAAQRQGASLADVREMMAIHREMKADEARESFREDFAAFRGENIIIPKSKHVDRGRAGSFFQAEFDEVCRRLSPALSKHGFGFRHDQRFGFRRVMNDGTETDVGWVFVTCYLEHRKGHAEKLELEGPPGDLSANTPVQNMQATASYLKRQGLLAITGTATGGEDDEGAAGANRAADWAARVDETTTEDDLRQVSREGSKVFTEAKDVPGYASFMKAVQKHGAKLKGAK